MNDSLSPEHKDGAPAQRGVLLGFGSVMSMALATTIAKIALEEVPSLVFTALWAAFGGGLAITLLYSRGRQGQWHSLQENWRVLLAITLCSAVAQLSYFIAIAATHPALVVFLGRLDLVVASLLGVIILKERLVLLEIGGAILALTGVGIMSFVGQGLPLPALVFGTTSAVGAALALLLGKIAVANVDPLLLTAATRTGAGIVLLTVGFSTAQIVLPTRPAVLLFILLASFLGPFLSFLLLYKALSATELFRIAALRSLMPFGVVLFSYLLLQTIPSNSQIFGGIVTTAGIVLVAWSEHG